MYTLLLAVFPGVEEDGSVPSVARTELWLLAPRETVVRHRGTAFVPAPPRLAPEVDHSGLGVPHAELGLFVALHTVVWLRVAARVRARLAADIGHAVLGVRTAELSLLRAVHAEARPLRAARTPARLPSKVYRASDGVLGAELRRLAAGRAKARLRGAPCVLALRVDGEVDHALRGVLGARLSLSARHAVARVLPAAAQKTAPFGAHVDHAFLRMPGTELRPGSALYTVGWLLRAIRVSAPSLLVNVSEPDHAGRRVTAAELRLSAAPDPETRSTEATWVTAGSGHAFARNGGGGKGGHRDLLEGPAI